MITFLVGAVVGYAICRYQSKIPTVWNKIKMFFLNMHSKQDE